MKLWGTILLYCVGGTVVCMSAQTGTGYSPSLPSTYTFANLPASTNGTVLYCSDCTKGADPCAGGGTGADARRINGAWTCGVGVLPFANGGTNCAAPFPILAKTATYQVLGADFTCFTTITVASGTFTITLVASGAQPGAGTWLKVINYGSGVVTIARSGQNINGGTGSLTLEAATATGPSDAFISSDGTNYFSSLSSGYTTGSWTPTDTSGASLTFSNNASSYTKVGKLVCVTGNWSYPTTANGSNAQFGGLPFTQNANAFIGTWYSSISVTAVITVGNGSATTAQPETSALGRITNAALSNSFVGFSGCYTTP